ncbi:unnamed protein product [Didymodactylos carnosus]|uniref:Uncharacterized protein n=1 Tax=Didymodactylos carnosus TaxID=1234261 RepID=A0A814VUV3_9BILA|nr:unnamed protein product [Didymodactylos carnosus]CAF3958148.1 unnamed protein product [Didymodactylos carnosus]
MFRQWSVRLRQILRLIEYEIVGTGTILFTKDDFIIILTAFHVITPQYLLPLNQLLIIFTAVVISVIMVTITTLKYVNFQINYFYVVLFGLLYPLIGCLLLYLLIAIFFPLLSSSSFKLELVNDT